MALAKAQSGSCRREPKDSVKFLLVEMDFLKKYIEDNEPTTSNFNNVVEVDLFDHTQFSESSETTMGTHGNEEPSSSRRKRKLPEETELEKTCKKISLYAEALMKEDDRIDPFFHSLNEDFKTLPPLKKQELKIKFMELVYAAKREQSEEDILVF
ncbi:hypothetical protein PSTG_18985 [Puccinia striiformis f. sp. tritici PST-78]|uniref:BESS domain-containing protein n=1 Tax=Puccinia striiformis f. sp. tritici PST-78 TaxID=1165861 RepID=A0A0L0UKT4_9BASI|nr:hypothetical protein PSTG_18985 [Puccinia striiformis f. sp. tritici PST-78]